MSYQATWTLLLDGTRVANGACGSLSFGSVAAALLRPLAASLEALMLGASAAVILHEHACAARDDASAAVILHEHACAARDDASAAVILHEHACAARDDASALSPQSFQMLHFLLGYEGMARVELAAARPAQALPAPPPATAPTSSSPPNLRTEPLGDHDGDLGAACPLRPDVSRRS